MEGGIVMATPATPTNVIVQQGTPLYHNLITESTVTEMKPGRLLITGTTDGQCKIGTVNGDVIGWLGYEQTAAPFRDEHTVDTAYALLDEVPVLYGGNFIINAGLANGQNVAKGARLCAAANGELTAATALTATTPSGSTAVTSTSATPVMTQGGALPTQNIPVAIAMQSVNASGGAKDILVLSLI